MSRSPSHPGVRFPPPLLFVAALGAGILCHRLRPLPLTPPGARTLAVLGGWLLVGSWAVLSAWAMVTFIRARTAMYPNRPATTLVIWGPYHFSRNPMYVALSALYLGVTVLADTIWPVPFLPGVWVLLYWWVVRREERYLTAAFGDQYEAYRARVRRWL